MSRNAKNRSRKLKFEILDDRWVLSTNPLALESLQPSEAASLASDLTLSATIDTVDGTTSFRNLNVGGYTGSPDVVALNFIRDHAKYLGLPSDITSELSLIDTKVGLASSHAYFQQTHAGMPVHGGQITVSMNGQGSVQTVHNAHVNHQAGDPALPANAKIPADMAAARVEDQAGVLETSQPTESELVWYAAHGTEIELAWQLNVHVSQPSHQELVALVRAVDGRILSMEDHTAHATGTGNVFYPNPHQTQGSADGLADNNDANSAALEAQLQSVTLERLNEGTGLLIGDWVDLTLEGGKQTVAADEPTRVYNYDRSDDRFEEVVVYYVIDQIQEYIHALGYDDDTGAANGIRDFPTRVSAHWDDDQNAFYSVFGDTIHFGDAGDSGVDVAEDGDVIAHEYGHAIQHNQNPNWGGGDMGAMGEGFGDYLAASFFANVGDPTYQSVDAAAIGEWAFQSDLPGLRRVDGDKHYPEDLNGSVHDDGEIWSAALWQIRGQLGGTVTDTLVLESHFGLPGGALMPAAALAVIEADINLNGGANESVIRSAFEARGILRAPDDVGNTALDATPLSVPGSATFVIDYQSDPDFFVFDAVAGTTYEFTSTATTGDTTLTLIGPPGTEILGFDNNGGGGLNARLLWTASSTEPYFINASGSTAGAQYQLIATTIATPADDHGDPITAATVVTNPSQTDGQIEVANDIDSFAIQVISGTAYEIEVLRDSLADANLEIVDSNLGVLVEDSDGGEASAVYVASFDGTVYARVRGLSQGSYAIVVDEVADDHANIAASATPVGLGQSSGTLDYLTDRDFFAFPTVDGQDYSAEVILDFSETSLNDSVLTLYAPDGTTELVFDDDDGFFLGSQIEWQSTGGTYFLEVGAFLDAGEGTYQLELETVVISVDDHGDTPATATHVDLRSNTTGILDTLSDLDFFAFTVTAGTEVTASTFLTSLFGSAIDLYAPDGTTILATDDDFGFDSGSEIEYTVQTGGTYYVAVRGSLGSTGGYRFRLRTQSPNLPCDFVGNGNGCNIDDIDVLYAGTDGAPSPLSDALIGEWLSEASDPSNLLKPTTSTQFVHGDTDLDGDVDSIDLGRLLNNFLDTMGLGWGDGNLNADTDVDSLDLGLLLNNFSFTSPVMAASQAFAIYLPSSASFPMTAVQRQSIALDDASDPNERLPGDENAIELAHDFGFLVRPPYQSHASYVERFRAAAFKAELPIDGANTVDSVHTGFQDWQDWYSF